MQRTGVVRTMSKTLGGGVNGALVANGNVLSRGVSNGKARDGPAARLSTEVEAHTVVSALLLACSVGCDALSAKDVPFDATDCPSALRVSSLVLTAMLGSPQIKGIHLADQRVVIGSLLIALAFSGLHQATEEMRTADCVFCTLVLFMTIQIYKSGGIEAEDVRPDSVRDKPHRRQTVSGLCAALFVYCGARGIRDAFAYARVAADYKVEFQLEDADTITTATTYGYAHATVYVSAPLGFGYGVILCLGILTGLHDETHLVGSNAIAFEAGVSGVAACVAALWALVGKARSMESLLVLYGPGACSGGQNVCYEAARSRRLVMVNGSTGPLWAAGLAAMVFSFAVEKRFLKGNPTNAESLWKRQGMGISLALVCSAVACVLFNSQLDDAQWHTEICTIVVILGAFLSSVYSTLLGTTMYVVAMTYEQVVLLQNYGTQQVFVHMTHCTLFVSLVFMWAHVVLMALKGLLVEYCHFDLEQGSIINQCLGIIATFGTSLTFGLYLASAVLLSASNGQLPQEEGDIFRGGSPTRSMIAFVLDHFLPLCVWIPLYACRCEINTVSAWSRTVAWLLAVPLQAALYILVLAIIGQAAPTVSIVQITGAGVVGFTCTVAWVAAAYI